jgi:hypothetical protein
LWPLLRAFNPVIALFGAVTASALSQARARLPSAWAAPFFPDT